MQPEHQQRIMGYFIEEAKDHLTTLEQGLLNLQNTIEDPETINEVFRAAHSVKGGAAMLGINSIQRTAHRLEDYFKILKEHPTRVEQKLESLMLRVFDALEELLDQLQEPFGLTEERANEVMSGVEPVFEELDGYLTTLVHQSDAPRVALKAPPPMSEQTILQIPEGMGLPPEDSALRLVFQSDVPSLLREMLQLFKQADNAETRQQLQEICQNLASAGEQFDLPTWVKLVRLVRSAIANPENTYRTLAPVSIKELKQAQDLVLAGRYNEITIGERLQELQPPESILAAQRHSELEEISNLMPPGTDWAMSLGDLSEPLSSAFEQLNISQPDNTPVSLEPEPSFELFDLNSQPSVSKRNDLSESRSTPLGPEVGMAELNTLADLFEGEAPDLGLNWQEEEGGTQGNEDLNLGNLDEDTDFSDLLLSDPSSEHSLVEKTSTKTKDTNNILDDNLFGEELELSADADFSELLEIQGIMAAKNPQEPSKATNEFADLLDIAATIPPIGDLDEQNDFEDLLGIAAMNKSDDDERLKTSSEFLGLEEDNPVEDLDNDLDQMFAILDEEPSEFDLENQRVESENDALNALFGEAADSELFEDDSTGESALGLEKLDLDFAEASDSPSLELEEDEFVFEVTETVETTSELDFELSEDSSESSLDGELDFELTETVETTSELDFELGEGSSELSEGSSESSLDGELDFELTETVETTSELDFELGEGSSESSLDGELNFELTEDSENPELDENLGLELTEVAELEVELTEASENPEQDENLGSERTEVAASSTSELEESGDMDDWLESPTDSSPQQSLDIVEDFFSVPEIEQPLSATRSVEVDNFWDEDFGIEANSDRATLPDEEALADIPEMDESSLETLDAAELDLSEADGEALDLDLTLESEGVENEQLSLEEEDLAFSETEGELLDAALSEDSAELELLDFDDEAIAQEPLLLDEIDTPSTDLDLEFAETDELATSGLARSQDLEEPEVEFDLASVEVANELNSEEDAGLFDLESDALEAEGLTEDLFAAEIETVEAIAPVTETEEAGDLDDLFGSSEGETNLDIGFTELSDASSEVLESDRFLDFEGSTDTEDTALFNVAEAETALSEDDNLLAFELEASEETAEESESLFDLESSSEGESFLDFGESQTEEASVFDFEASGSETESFLDLGESQTEEQPENPFDFEASASEGESFLDLGENQTEEAPVFDFDTSASETESFLDLGTTQTEEQPESLFDFEASASEGESFLDFGASQTEEASVFDFEASGSENESFLDLGESQTEEQPENPFDFEASASEGESFLDLGENQTEEAPVFDFDTSASEGESFLDFGESQTEEAPVFDFEASGSETESFLDLGESQTEEQPENLFGFDTSDSETENFLDLEPLSNDTERSLNLEGTESLFEVEETPSFLEADESFGLDLGSPESNSLDDFAFAETEAAASEESDNFDGFETDESLLLDFEQTDVAFPESSEDLNLVETTDESAESSDDLLDFDFAFGLDESDEALDLGLTEAEETETSDSFLDFADEAEAIAESDSDFLNFDETEETTDLSWLNDITAEIDDEPPPSAARSLDFESTFIQNEFAQDTGTVDLDALEAFLGDADLKAAPTASDLQVFDELEAFLEQPVTLGSELGDRTASDLIQAAAIETQTSDNLLDDSEFDDLVALLEDADKSLGGPPTMTARHPGMTPPRRPNRIEQNMRVPVKQLDNLSNLVGELVVNRNSLEQDQERLRQCLDNLLYQVQQLSDVGARMRDLYERSLLESALLSSRMSNRFSNPTNDSEPANHATGVKWEREEMDLFTPFHTLSQEMIELIVRVRESSSDIEFIVDETDQVTRQFRQITTQLQEGLTRARMVPFAQTADRLPGAVRRIAMDLKKQAEILIEGRETLIDKMIQEQLFDPMTHLINNAMTHGIETPEERMRAGKSPVGKIMVRAFHQGNQTVISVSDDGAGINPERVKMKALEKRLITPEEAKSMTRLDVYDLLFRPGFSTKDQADSFSGRGVGMDVVRTSLRDIRGVINTDSTLGKGTTFTIRLPLTLSISKALCCISSRARIAFPMDGVEDMLDVPKDRIQTNNEGQSCFLWRDTLLPFQPLAELLQYNRQISRGSVYGGHQEDDIISIVVLRSAGQYIALQVDQVLGEQEIVIKQLEGPVPKPVGIAGATVLGDGRIMPIADVLELIDLSMGRARRETNTLWETENAATLPETIPTKVEPTVLIVDDSITVRELLSMTFNKAGYRVEQARDGQDAWEKLRSGLPCDIVFCDIEMPRMDGLELLSRLQKDSALKHLPVAMLTSRGAERHRQTAASLGAKGYFTKPYLEEALLEAASRMLKGEVLVTAKAGS
ncbi:MAG: response regulator [Cyanobacteria bacterium FC1]|nr:response regulator [Cyanobacteria bacterium FC1]